MNVKLKELIERVDSWPTEAQEEAVQMLLALEHERVEPYELTAEDRAAIDGSIQDMRQGRLATDDEVAAAFSRARR
jgi:hypothetical protein